MEKTIVFTIEELNLVLNALADQPYKAVAGLIQKIIEQANQEKKDDE